MDCREIGVARDQSCVMDCREIGGAKDSCAAGCKDGVCAPETNPVPWIAGVPKGPRERNHVDIQAEAMEVRVPRSLLWE